VKKALIAWFLTFLAGLAMGQWQQKEIVGRSPLINSNRGKAVLLDALGEGKTLMARFLYFRAEVYHEILDRQGVRHDQQKDLLPLLRMVTYLDPSLTETFDVIAWDLWKGWGKAEEALELLDEAVLYNPSSFKLWFRKSFILFREKRYEEALPAILQATKVAEDEFDILNANRLKFWCAKELDRLDLQKEAIDLLVERRPQDVLFNREQKRVERELAESH
jgi:tetratricopeptide (TPR) repeat protein